MANTLEVWFRAYKELFKLYNIKASYQEIGTKAYGDPYGCVHFGINDVDRFNARLFALVEDKYVNAPLYPNVIKTLKLLRQETNHKVCIFTSTKRNLIIQALKQKKMDQYFDFVIGREDVNKLKPDPQGIEIILNKYFFQKNQTIIIGDTDKDIIAGAKGGIDTVLFVPKHNLKYYNPKDIIKLTPTHTINSISEIIHLM